MSDLRAIEPALSDELCVRYVVGVDLGQAKDYSALVVNRVTTAFSDTPFHNLIALFRWPLNTPYPAVCRSIVSVMQQLPKDALDPPELVMDQTGVGKPVLDLAREYGLAPTGLMITGGNEVSHPYRMQRNIPKKVLASCLLVMLQARRLRIARAMPLTETLTKELGSFKVRISASGGESFESWRENSHDDLVLATAIAVYVGEHPNRAPVVRLI
jgi:hypothetical protein